MFGKKILKLFVKKKKKRGLRYASDHSTSH